MVLEEIILSNRVLFNEQEKLRDGGKKFLEHISKYAKRVVILGFKSVYAEQLSFYVQNHSKDANLVLDSNSEIAYRLLAEEERLSKGEKLPIKNYTFIGYNETELSEAKEWNMRYVRFNPILGSNSIDYPSFNSLKDVIRYLSD